MGTEMRQIGIYGIFLFLVGLPGLHPADRDLAEFLPADPAVRPWSVRGSPQQFRGRGLFDYMDGGADLYLEFGFHRVLVQEYVRENHSIELEVYLMEDDAAAYGMYSVKKGSEGKQVAIGQESFLSDSYLNFWTGSFLVTLVGMDQAEETRTGLHAIALAVSRKISPEGNRPALISLLPTSDRVESSLQYFKGNLGFRNVQNVFPPASLKFAEGVRAEYRTKSGERGEYLIRFHTEALASEGFEVLKARIQNNPKYLMAAESGGVWVENREKGTMFFLTPFRNFLILYDRLQKEDIPSLLSPQRESILHSR